MENLSVKDVASKDGKLLIIDDDASTRLIIKKKLGSAFEIVEADSGDHALELLPGTNPDLILLDIGMPGIDGYETCKRIREQSNIPVIFVSAHYTLAEQLHAYDSGGNDILQKPIDFEILLRKIRLHIRNKTERVQLLQEKDSMQKMAMNFLSTVGESGVLLNFMRNSFRCNNHTCLATQLIEATKSYGLECHVQIRHASGITQLSNTGTPTPLQESIMEQARGLGRIFQFSNRMIVNYDRVSILASNLPVQDEEKLGRIRDHLSILTESAEAFSEVIDIREEAARRSEYFEENAIEMEAAIETLHGGFSGLFYDAQLLLHGVVESVERTYSSLGMTQHQEYVISNSVKEALKSIAALFERAKRLDDQFASRYLK